MHKAVLKSFLLFLVFTAFSCKNAIENDGAIKELEGENAPEKKTFSVTFHANGGKGAMPPQKFASDEEKKLCKNEFSREGKIFAGWAESPNGEKKYSDEQKISISKDEKLYALWDDEPETDSDETGDDKDDEGGMSGDEGDEPADETGDEGGTSGDEPEIDDENPDAITVAEAIKKLQENPAGDIELKICGTSFSGLEEALENRAENGGGAVLLDLSEMNVTTIPEKAFVGSYIFDEKRNSKNNIETVILPKNLKTISESAFNFCNLLKNVIFPETVEGTLGRQAFYCCKNLENVTLPPNVTEIAKQAFCGCTKLKTLTLPAKVERICDSAFMDCISLESVTIPKSCVYIGDSAFMERLQWENWIYALSEVVFENQEGWVDKAGNPVDVSDPAKNAERLAWSQGNDRVLQVKTE